MIQKILVLAVALSSFSFAEAKTVTVTGTKATALVSAFAYAHNTSFHFNNVMCRVKLNTKGAYPYTQCDNHAWYDIGSKSSYLTFVALRKAGVPKSLDKEDIRLKYDDAVRVKKIACKAAFNGQPASCDLIW